MSFNFDEIFDTALDEAVDVAEKGGKAAEDWIKESAKANKETLRAIGEGVAKRQLSKDTASMLLRENRRALDSEAAALAVIIKATVQGAVNAFFESIFAALSSALEIAI